MRPAAGPFSSWMGCVCPGSPRARPVPQQVGVDGRRMEISSYFSMNIGLAILIKLLSVLLFAMMSALVRFVGDVVPVGQVVFFRSAFAIVPVLAIYAWRGEIGAAVRTGRPLGHLTRGLISVASMFLNFAALARLPLVDATAISFAAPLHHGRARGDHPRRAGARLSLVGGRVGFCGVVVMLWPYLDVAALIGRVDVDHRRRAVRHHRGLHQCRGGDPDAAAHRQRDHRLDRVLLLADLHACGACTLPFAWVTPSATRVRGADRHRRHRRIVPYLSHRELPLRAGFGGGAVRLRGAAVGVPVRLRAVRRGPDGPCLCRRRDRRRFRACS